MNEWISVKDELPKPESEVICTGTNGKIFICEYTSAGFGCSFLSTDWYHGKYGQQPEITHWMPLPDAPKDKT